MSVSLLACTQPSGDSRPFLRLVDHESGQPEHNATIGDTRMQVLDPAKPEHTFTLDDGLPDHPLLTFAVGMEPDSAPASIRFEVLLKSAGGEPQLLYEKLLSSPGWQTGKIDLASSGLKGAELVFRKMLAEGSKDALAKGVWGNPLVVSGDPGPSRGAILISLDTLRADRVGIYGHGGARTPVLDALARNGAWYEYAYSPSSWTYPSHRCLLRGLYPSGMDLQKPPIARILRSAGFLTAGFTGGGIMSSQWGFGDGFGTYFMYQRASETNVRCPPERFDGRTVFDRAIDWLRRYGHLPFFLFIHTYEVHDRCEFLPSGKKITRLPDPGPDGRRRLIEHYDRLIARADGLVGDLLRQLETLGIDQTTLIAVLSDHGEALWEHGSFGHDCFLKPYEGMVRVPLILRYPSRISPAGKISTPVSAIDVVPTILEFMGSKVPPMQAQALPGLGLPAPAESRGPVYSACGDVLAVWDGRSKLITSRKGAFPDEIYDLQLDPRERQNRAGENPDAGVELRRYAAAYWSGGGKAHPTPDLNAVDEQTRERLRVLGYVE